MIVVGITGASGSILGIRLIEELLNNGERVSCVISDTAIKILSHELSIPQKENFSLKEVIKNRSIARDLNLFTQFDNNNFFSPIASGSTIFESLIIIPCSMKTLSSIAHGYASSLITRVADVAIKEKRKCIIVPRETPLSMIHIENMYKVATAGVIIAPPMLTFYNFPKSMDDNINFMVGKILNLLGKKHSLFKSWEEITNEKFH
ncbi:MAG: UbiX family flavin prenyltransferase [Desulfobacterales bacterium]|nr:UbiX family flavin prenyltransferase [Desulfobacterales bacterium]